MRRRRAERRWTPCEKPGPRWVLGRRRRGASKTRQGRQRPGWREIMHSKIDTGVQKINSRLYEAHDRRFALGSRGGFGGSWRDWAGREDGARPVWRRWGPYQVGVKLRRFRNGGFWAMLVCPRCGGGSQRLRLLDGQPACGKCVRASGLIYRSQSVRTEKRHSVTAPTSSRHARQRQTIACPSSTGPDIRRAGELGVRVAAIADRRAQTSR